MMEPTQIQNNNEEPIQIQSELNKPIQPLKREAMLNDFAFLGSSSLIYGIIFAVCMYQNLYGVASSILICATFGYAYLILKRLGCTFEKKHMAYVAAGVLLGINLMFTADPVILFVDYVAILLIYVTGFYSVLYGDMKWDFIDSCKAVYIHIFASIPESLDIVYDYGTYNKTVKKESKSRTGHYIVIGIIAAVPLLILVTVLLSGADAVFGNITGRIFDELDFGTVIGITLVLVGAILGSYAWLAHFMDRKSLVTHKDGKNGEPVILITIGIILGMVYLVFCGIQIIYLFAGLGTLPNGYTYASYAREGFFQLLFVCIINLIIVLTGIKHFKKNSVLNAVLTVITGCTYIMIASSAYRMFLYISIYQLSVLRLWVLWTLVWLGFILTGALINIYYKEFSLFRYSMIATSILYLFLAYARPAYVVAEYNLNTITAETKVDYNYIASELNPDATTPIWNYMNSNAEGKEELQKEFRPSRWKDDISTDIKSARKYNISEYNFYKRFCK